MLIPCMRCVSHYSHTGYLAHANSKGEARRSRHQNNSYKVLRNMEERNMGTVIGKVTNEAKLTLRT